MLQPKPHCLGCCSFIISLEIKRYIISNLVFLFKIFLAFLGPLISYKFWCPSLDNCYKNLLNLGEITTLAVMSYNIYNDLFLHLFKSLISLKKFLQFSVNKMYTFHSSFLTFHLSFLKFIQRNFICTFVNRVALTTELFLISTSNRCSPH